LFFTVFSATILVACDFLKLLLYYQNVKQDFPFFWDLTLHHWLIGLRLFFTVFSATILVACDFLKLLLYYQNVKQDFPFFWDLTLHHWLIGAQHFKITTFS